MGRAPVKSIQLLWSKGWKLPFLLMLPFAVWLSGCNNTCVIFTSNPPTGTIGIKISDPSPSCSLTRVNGAVRVMLQKIPVCSSCSESGQVQHAFVSIKGIDVHASSVADDNSPDWLELAPQMATQPLQIDLVKTAVDQNASELLTENLMFPAGEYRQLRVRFTANFLATNEAAEERNACGSSGFNCVVMADGTVHSILFDTRSSAFRITSEGIAGGALLLVPGTENDVVIELKPFWSWVSSVNTGVRFLPALIGNARVERAAPGDTPSE